MNSTGCQVEYLTQYMASTFLLVWLSRRRKSLGNRRPAGSANATRDLVSAELRITPVANGLLAFLLTLEARVIARRRQLPIGTSLLAIARKE